MRYSLLTVLFSISISAFAYASTVSICGIDSRTPSDVKPIGRLYGKKLPKSNCTVTMISANCAVTAGHCVKGDFDKVEFNVPLSSADGSLMRSEAVDQYEVGKVLDYKAYVGHDWAVLHLKANIVTGKAAGDVQGMMKISSEPVSKFINSKIRISGYGSYLDDFVLNSTQQTAIGTLFKTTIMNSLKYDVDTDSGNSGATIIQEETQEIIGIHTNGGCPIEGELNEGTIIHKNKKMLKAINACLKL